MKKTRQQLRQQLSQPIWGWLSCRKPRRRWRQTKHRIGVWLTKKWTALRQAVQRTNWRVIGGTYAGIMLAIALICVVLAMRGTKPPHAATHRQKITAVRQEMLNYLNEGISITVAFSEIDIDSARMVSQLTTQELLRFRKRALTQLRYINQLRQPSRREQLRRLPNQLNLAEVNLYRKALDELRLDSALAEMAVDLFPVITATQRELAQVRLQYLNQPGPPSSAFANPDWQRRLTQLQLRDAQPRHLTATQLDTLRRSELSQLRAIELQRSELLTAAQRPAARFLDSCRRELLQLRLLDSCRQELTYWFPGSFGPAYIASSSEEHIRYPQNYADQPAFSPESPKLPSRWSEVDILTINLLTILTLLMAAPLISGVSFVLVRRKLQARPPEPAPEVEPPVLQALLLAYADTIREVLLMPRKIKRFAGKVRLQYYLLGALSQEQIRLENQFKFDPAEQVLAFLLLLLLEQRTQRLHTTLKDATAFRQQLLADYQEALAINKFEATDGQIFSCKQGIVTLRLGQGAAAGGEIIVLSKALKGPNAERLLKQLYWLNAGLLV